MNQPEPVSVKKPQSRGRIIDFTPRRPITTPDPRYVSKPIIKMPEPEATEIYEEESQIVVHHQPPAPKPRPTPRPTPRPAPRPPVQYTAPVRPIRKRPLSQPAPIPVSHPAPQLAPQPQPAPQPKPKPTPAPLGVRSPFLKSSVTVEKRPLSGGTATSTRSHSPRRQSTVDLARHQIERSNTVKLANRKSKLPFALLIIGTILVGAAVGACAYFLVFQGE